MPTPDQVATASIVLGKASLLDQTFARPDAGIAFAWAEAMGDVNRDDALSVVTEHYRAETRRIMPKDILDGVRRLRRARLEQDPQAIPDVDPDDPDFTRKYIQALRDGNFRSAEGEKPRPVAQLLSGHGMPSDVRDKHFVACGFCSKPRLISAQCDCQRVA